MQLNFPVKADKLSGLVRNYKDKGYPSIELYPSSSIKNHNVSNILDYSDDQSHWASTLEEKLNAQLVIKIADGPFYITHYSIRSHPSANYYMQAWTFEGSMNNKTYTMLDNRPQNADLNSSKIGQYRVNPKRKRFQYFRIKQTMPTLVVSHENMRISGIDFYGSFIAPNDGCSHRYCSHFSKNIFVYIVAVVS